MHNILCLFRILVVLICVSLTACDNDPYNGFGCVANESHPAVKHARSLSSAELELAYNELAELGKNNKPPSFHKHYFGDDIPATLSFLKAEAIRITPDGNTSVFLANCFDERVIFQPELRGKDATITLYWAAPTTENPYATGNEILWQKSYD